MSRKRRSVDDDEGYRHASFFSTTDGGASKRAESLSRRRRHDPTTFAETDSPESLALAIPAKDHLVAVLQEPARLTSRQIDRLGAALRQFDQRAQAVFRRARDRAAREQVARLQIAAVARVVG